MAPTTVNVARRFASSSDVGREVDVVIAVGTNMGNRGLNLHRGLRRLRELGLQVLRHSALYETAAAYVTAQPPFLNGALLARTDLPPRELLKLLKRVEAEAGRDLAGGPRFGPRPLDLDIVFLGSEPFRDEALQVPHPRWRERPFVMAPVSDLLYRRDGLGREAAGEAIKAGPWARGPLSEGEVASSSCSSSTGGSSRGSDGSSGSACRGSGGGQRGRDPLPEGHPGSVLGYVREVRRAWLAAADSHAGGGGGGGDRSGGGGLGPSGGEVMRRVTPLINLPPREPDPSANAPSEAGAAAASSSPGAAGDSLLSWGGRTQLMAILNVTPDSFSDGGAYGGSVAAAVAAAERAVAEGADLVDVGGQSTRPGAARLGPQEELARVLPVIRALRQSPALRSVPISVDTFYAEVARQAVTAVAPAAEGWPGGGANIVNDVSGGEMDPGMRETVAELGVPYVVMHMRGDPGSMSRPEHTAYGCVWREVGRELQARAEAAEAAGVAAWNIILDPGIGFAKTAEGNLDLLRNLPAMRREALDGSYGAAAAEGGGAAATGAPMLVGPSRKRFLGTLTGRTAPADRDAATAAACVVAVGGGADMVRVHAVAPVRDALAVADAVYRQR